jgi:hypothetical protein
MPAIWAVIWIISFFNASLGVALVPTVDIGGLCFFPSTPPALYGNLVLFIPRTLLFMIVIGLYVHLFRFFRKSAVKAKATETASFGSILPGGEAPCPTPVSFSSANHYQFPLKPNSQFPENGTVPERSPVASSFSSSSSKLGTAYQSIWGRKGSKDSETTLVNHTQTRIKPSQSPRKYRLGNTSPLDMPIIENSEENGAMGLKRVHSLQNSDAILSGSGGFESQLKMLESPSDPPTRSSSASHRVSFNTPPSFSRRAAPDTSAYRFPPQPIHLPPRDYMFPASRPPISPGTSEPRITKELEPAIQLQSQEAQYQRVRQSSITELSGDGIESQTLDADSGSITLDTPNSRDDAETPPKGGIMGFEEALQNVAPTLAHERKMSLDPDMPYITQRRMSAAEESRRVSYLMMLYPAAVRSAFTREAARMTSR